MALYLVCPFKLKVDKQNQKWLSKKLRITGLKKNPAVDRALRGSIKKMESLGATFLDLDAPGSLAGLRGDDALLVEGHGWWGTGRLFSNNAFDTATYTGADSIDAAGLAGKIGAAGLPETHRLVVLLSCFGSGLMEQDEAELEENRPDTYVRYSGAKGEGFMASVLAAQLGVNGYANIRVTGYPSEVTISPGEATFRTVTHYARDPDLGNYWGFSGTAAELAKTYDAAGREVETVLPDFGA